MLDEETSSHDQEEGEEIGAAKARPTMQDVAQMAKVSLKTVSRVVNKEPRVNKETSDRVEEAIRLLGFRRNDIARSLRQGQSSLTIGLVIEDIANPFYSHLARGVEQVAQRYNHMLIVSSSEEKSQRERELVNAMLRRCTCALVVDVPCKHRFTGCIHHHPTITCIHAVLKQQISCDVVAGNGGCQHRIGSVVVCFPWSDVLHDKIAACIANP